MKEFTFPISKELSAGIATEDVQKTSAAYMEECYNYKPTVFGLDTPAVITNPSYSATLITEFLHTGEEQLLLIRTNGILPVNTAFVIGAALLSATGTKINANCSDQFLSTSRTHAVNLNGQWLITSDNRLVCSHPSFTPAGIGSSTGGPTPKTCCLHQSRTILANFTDTSSRSTDADFARIWKDLIWKKGNENVYEGFLPNSSTVIIGPAVSGSKSDTFLLELALLYGYQSTLLQAAIDLAVRSKQLQVCHCPQVGDIMKVLSFGNRIIIFGKQGVGMLAQGEQGDFEYRPLSSVGVPYKNSACLGREKVVWVDNDGNIWHMFGEFIPYKKLYRHLFAGSSWEVSYDSVKENFYITNITLATSYVYTNLELVYKTRHKAWCMFSRESNSYGFFTEDSAGESARIVVCLRDMNLRANKKVEYIAANFEGTDLKVGVKFRYGARDTYKEVQKRVNKEGIAYNFPEATDIKVIASRALVTTPGTLDSQITELVVAWKAMDKRPIRGLVVQDGSAGANTTGE